MSSYIQPGLFLRRTLLADAASSAAVGALMAAAAAPLQRLTGLPAALLFAAGLALFPYAGYLVWIATRAEVPRLALWAPIVLNVVWAADCVLVALGDFNPTAYGKVFLAVQVVTVLAFAELEFAGLRRVVPAQ